MSELSNKKCVPCGGNFPPMSDIEAEKLLQQLNEQTPKASISPWKLYSGKLRKEYKFVDFNEAMKFVNKVSAIAEEEGHHPDITISYNKVILELITHAIGGLSENDFILAAKIDEITLA